MTSNEIFNILNIKPSIADTKINNIKTDSKKVKKDDLFIALKGRKYDGNEYVLEAIKNGAILCITDRNIEDVKCIKAEDTYKALSKIAHYIRNKYSIPVIAITGSNGKTTTKELIVHILKSKYNVLYNKENSNNIIGVSSTLFKLNSKADIIILELGSNHMGEIKTLSNMCNPTTSIITNIGSSHIGNFKNKKNIFKEKNSIVSGMSNIKLIVNGDDKYLKKLDSIKCGFSNNNNLIAYDIKENIDSTSFKIKIDKEYTVKLNIPGKHFVIDALLAIKTCLDYVDIKTIIKRLSSFKLMNKRMSIKKVKTNTIINDCYNSSLESVIAGLNYLENIKDNKVIILADILELGRHAKNIHKKINELIKDNVTVLTVGKYAKYIKGKNFINIDELIEYLKNNPIKNSYIYIKGSRRTGLDKIVEYLEKR